MKQNIAFIITKSEIGGAQTWVLELSNILEPHFNIFLITSEEGWLTKFFPEKNIFILPGLSSIKKPSSILKIYNFIKKNKISTVVSNSANAGLYSRLAKILKPHKHIYVSHGWSCIYNGGRFRKLFCQIEKLLSLLSNTILCVSERDRKNAIDIIGINNNKIKVIKNKISPLPQKININEKKRVLFVGRMVHPKRADLFIDVAKKIPHMDFYLVGDGPLTNNLKQLSKECNKNIFFLGEINNFKSYNNFDIFVLLSDSEGLPMSAIEAGSAGLPLVMSNVGGCSELIYTSNNYQNGLLVENNIEYIVRSLTELSNNYLDYYNTAQNVRHEFDIKSVANDYIKLIQG